MAPRLEIDDRGSGDARAFGECHRGETGGLPKLGDVGPELVGDGPAGDELTRFEVPAIVVVGVDGHLLAHQIEIRVHLPFVGRDGQEDVPGASAFRS